MIHTTPYRKLAFSHFSCGSQPAAQRLQVGLWDADLQSEFPCPCLGLTLYLTCNPQLGKRKSCSHSSEDMSKMVSRQNVKDSQEVSGSLQATLEVISCSFPFLLHSHPLSHPASGQRR
uniref:Uncharacterized protein n=1 Tax=Cebus imitator TaxID=2715852 RepID=A0A2K5QDE7_CEBIM